MNIAVAFIGGMGFMLLLVIVREEIEERRHRKVGRVIHRQMPRRGRLHVVPGVPPPVGCTQPGPPPAYED